MEYGSKISSDMVESGEPKLKVVFNRLEKANAFFRQLNENIEIRLNSLVGSIPSDNQKDSEPKVNCAIDELHRIISSLEGNLSALERSEKRLREIV